MIHDLRACLEADGFGDVRTTSRAERALHRIWERDAHGKARTDAQRWLVTRRPSRCGARGSCAIVDGAPEGFGVDRERFRSDVIFLMPPLTPARAIADVPTREGVDRAWTGPGVLYFERLDARAAQSRLSKIVSLPIYRSLTIRNWATTCRLLEMLETPEG